jgi:hypothetical protein
VAFCALGFLPSCGSAGNTAAAGADAGGGAAAVDAQAREGAAADALAPAGDAPSVVDARVDAGGAPADAATSADGPPQTVEPCSALPSSGTWQNITPPSVTSPGVIALDPFDVGTLWLADSPGGLYKSSDCGATWAHVSTGTNSDKVDTAFLWSMAVDYKTPGIIYLMGLGPGGIWKSTDGGVDWAQLIAPGSDVANALPEGPSNPTVAGIGSISMDPNDPLHLIAGTHATCMAPHYPLCEIETTDGGQTWRIVDVNIPGVTGWLEQTGPYVLDAKTSLYATLFNGLWLTTDDGQTWANVTPQQVYGATGGEYAHRPLRPSARGMYYLPGYGGSNGLLESSDARSWSWVPSSPTGAYELGIAVAAGRVYLSDAEGATYASADEADLTTWSVIATPPGSAGGPLNGGVSLEYDDTHHLLYAIDWASPSLVWRMVTP